MATGKIIFKYENVESLTEADLNEMALFLLRKNSHLSLNNPLKTKFPEKIITDVSGR